MRSKKRLLQRRPFLFACFIFCSVFAMGYFRSQWSEEEIPFRVLANDEIRNFLVNTSGCQIPEWNPWDESVLPLYKPSGPYKCTGSPAFLRTLPNGVVLLEDSLLQFYYEIEPQNVSCVLQEIHRDVANTVENVDNHVVLGKPQVLKFDRPLELDHIKTACQFTRNSGEKPLVFEDYLALTPLKTEVENRCVSRTEKLTNKPMNVVLLGIESISQLNFIRHFPKCNKFLSKLSTSITMKGYTKVGDNTFPNIVPLLTGHFYQYYYDEARNKSMFFDDVDFSWKVFSELGYRTFMAEDAPNIATFNYYRNGFKKPPTDYYYRPLALAVENSEFKARSKGMCYGSKMEMQVVYEYFKNFVDTMGKNRPFFAFMFLARLTHDVFNFAGYADDPTFHLLQYLEEHEVLNNTLLIFYSDHGIRFGPIRKTFIGQVEERMPFMHLVFPKWFLEKHETFHKNLIINTERLTSPFDIHATVLHFAAIMSGNPQLEQKLKPGISLFHEIPSNRTCSQAGITPHWCPCQIHKAVSRSDLTVQEAAAAVIQIINNWTNAYRKECAVLSLNQILDARMSDKSHSLDVVSGSAERGSDNAFNDYLIVLSASPSDAIFEATVRCSTIEKVRCKVIDDISRINEYGKQSICVDNAELRKYCYCN